ncbi:hypothetical protein EVAR_95419_1 [Eumeta japonica]|uniref:Uncharacterized protein n=1 Tax=Eumeta variegata TaxID=151549 RepID=A0A4C1VJP9_EUMVA|nr:hypothetical protein EVAR_95419_1 [Eumeta japonica]
MFRASEDTFCWQFQAFQGKDTNGRILRDAGLGRRRPAPRRPHGAAARMPFKGLRRSRNQLAEAAGFFILSAEAATTPYRHTRRASAHAGTEAASHSALAKTAVKRKVYHFHWKRPEIKWMPAALSAVLNFYRLTCLNVDRRNISKRGKIAVIL